MTDKKISEKAEKVMAAQERSKGQPLGICLMYIQSKLSAPKDKQGYGYTYRNFEDVAKAVKPLLLRTKCYLTVSDDLVFAPNNEVIVKSTVSIRKADGEPGSIEAVGYAKVGQHKGMSTEQCYGCASSYARKYALCALLLVSSERDADDQMTAINGRR